MALSTADALDLLRMLSRAEHGKGIRGSSWAYRSTVVEGCLFEKGRLRFPFITSLRISYPGRRMVTLDDTLSSFLG